MDVAPFPAPEHCGEKARLEEEYRESVRLLDLAVSASAEARPRAIRMDYVRMQRYVDQAREKVEQARLALKQHIAEHRCGGVL